MDNNIRIKYVNRSFHMDQPSVFLFFQNGIPSFDAIRNGVAWRVINQVGRGSSCTFDVPALTQVNASWENGSCQTATMPAQAGSRFCVTMDETGIILREDDISDTTAIEVRNDIRTPGGVSVNLYKDGRTMMARNVVAYHQKATFVLNSKLYWGLASEIQEGSQLSSAVLDSDSFFEQDLEGISEAVVGLYGNVQDGYQFKIDSWK